MKNFRERLDFAFKQRGINQAEFARLMKTEPQNVNLLKVRGGIPRAHFIKACDTLHVNPSWLSDGKGSWEASIGVKETPNTYGATLRQVPLISSVAAGNWTDIADNYQPDHADEWMPCTKTSSKHAYALRIQGDSMEPDINDQEIVIVDPDRAPIHNDVVIVIQNGDTEATCKKLVIEGDRRYLKPVNTRYPIMKMQQDARICGVVVQSLKSWV